MFTITDPKNQKLKNRMDSASLRRGNIISSFAVTEELVTKFIIHHYIKDEELQNQMQEDVFEDEYFNFGLKLNIFSKILNKYYPDKSNQVFLNKLRQTSKIRNIIAHASLGFNFNKTTKKIVDPIQFFHNGKMINAEDKMDEYNNLKIEIQPKLIELSSKFNLFKINIDNDFTD